MGPGQRGLPTSHRCDSLLLRSVSAAISRRKFPIMKTKITVNANGSVKIEGEFDLVDGTGKAFGLGEKKAVFLCRCGQTKNQPFCDGSHKSCGFAGGFEVRDL